MEKQNINDTYVSQAVMTEAKNFEAIANRITNATVMRLIHASMGMITESAELVDQLKKHIFYGKELDLVNVFEEAGDTMWYMAIVADVLGEANFNRIMQTNIDKLRARYPDKFEYKSAVERDLDKERQILTHGFGDHSGLDIEDGLNDESVEKLKEIINFDELEIGDQFRFYTGNNVFRKTGGTRAVPIDGQQEAIEIPVSSFDLVVKLEGQQEND